MDSPADGAAAGYQARFAERWGGLRNPHVRALAWLIDSPGLLDPAAAEWAGKLAAPTTITVELAESLLRLDADPAPLLAALGERPYTRLGLYAEKLMAFFYQSQGRLVAHGLQVRASRNDTVGEFDFLLDIAGEEGVEHIELATKFYLLQGEGGAQAGPGPHARFDTLIGLNLADSLGAKMRKIIGKQLALANHPAAQAILPRPVVQAHALVKGWLFYPAATMQAAQAAGMAGMAGMAGITGGHCAGFWCTAGELAAMPAACWVILPRLQWLAPYLHQGDAPLYQAGALAGTVDALFIENRSPVMVASLRQYKGALIEASRGFVVPDDWQARALLRAQA